MGLKTLWCSKMLLGRLFTMFRGRGAKALSLFHEVALDSKKCRVNVSAFCAGFADSEFSRRENSASNNENLIRNQSTDRKFLGQTASHRLEHKDHFGRRRKTRIWSWKIKKRIQGLFPLGAETPLATTFQESLFAHSKLHAFSVMTTFFCVTLHGDSDWNTQNVHRGRLQGT